MYFRATTCKFPLPAKFQCVSSQIPKRRVIVNLLCLVSLMYKSLLESDLHLPCFFIKRSLTFCAAASLAPPERMECSEIFPGSVLGRDSIGLRC